MLLKKNQWPKSLKKVFHNNEKNIRQLFCFCILSLIILAKIFIMFPLFMKY